MLHGMNLKPEVGRDFKYKSTMKVLVLEKGIWMKSLWESLR